MSDIIAFSKYMFLENKNNKIIRLDLQGIENNKDLFLFFIDLFCKGIIVCYGINNTVNFDDLDNEKFNFIKQKMFNAGIIINLNISQNIINLPTHINSSEIDAEIDNKQLEEYIFKIYKEFQIYEITFSLTRI
jgi:hypothetical protein